MQILANSFLVISFLALAIFQIAITLGAPLGEYAYGGQNSKVLPRHLRIASVFSAILALAISGHYLAQLGVVNPLLPAPQNQLVNWLVVGFMTVASVMNNISKSKKERMVFGSATLLMLSAALAVALKL
jgi:hypothetical protein